METVSVSLRRLVEFELVAFYFFVGSLSLRYLIFFSKRLRGFAIEEHVTVNNFVAAFRTQFKCLIDYYAKSKLPSL